MTKAPSRSLLLLLGLGLGLMLVAVLSYLAKHPSLTVSLPKQEAAAPQNAGMPGSESRSPGTSQTGQTGQTGAPLGAGQNTDALAQLMQQLQTNPRDLEALLSLAGHFMHLEKWADAETFALRAVLAEPGNPRPLHLLGVIQHNQGRHAEAAQSLTQALRLKEDPSARFSLAILTAYYLKNPTEAATHLQKLLDTPDTPEDLRAQARDALAKLPKN